MYVVLFILNLYLAQAQTGSRCVEFFYNSEKMKISSQEDFLKTYLAMNLSYPQYRETITLGLVSFYFAKNVDFLEMTKGFSREQWDSVFNAMERSHKLHGVSRPVDRKEMERVFVVFVSPLPFYILQTLDVIVPSQKWPEGTKTFNDKLNQFLLNPELREEKNQLQRYSQSILDLLRSKEAMALSRQFRDSLNQIPSRPAPASLLTREDIAHSIKNLVVLHLEKTYPELKAKSQLSPTKKKISKALELYKAMVGDNSLP